MKTSVEKLFQMKISDKGFLLLGQGESKKKRVCKEREENLHVALVIPFQLHNTQTGVLVAYTEVRKGDRFH